MADVKIKENLSLQPYNTLHVEAFARYFADCQSLENIKEVLQWANKKKHSIFILGGGSNILFTKDVDGAVIRNTIKGIKKINEHEDDVYLKAGAGEVWHELVMYCLQNHYAGLENLALIPGFAGASPIQNIGAYGVEIKDVFYELTAIHRHTLEEHTFSKQDCAFGYRESIFKNRYRDEFVITDVTYRLNKKPEFHIEYGAIKQELEKQKVQQLSIQAIAKAVISIRSSKLPDPLKIGNAGSFFKNPTVTGDDFLLLKNQFPAIVAYQMPDGAMKLAAGWLIEQCGLKGYRLADAGIHDQQALVLVNYGNATGRDILNMCQRVIQEVEKKFGIVLEPEVNIV